MHFSHPFQVMGRKTSNSTDYLLRQAIATPIARNARLVGSGTLVSTVIEVPLNSFFFMVAKLPDSLAVERALSRLSLIFVAWPVTFCAASAESMSNEIAPLQIAV